MTTETLHACTECGDDYPTSELQFGVCDRCANVLDGLCPCGATPRPGYRSCGPCAAEDAADERFHADR